ncbi:MAG: hypothetical protein ACXACW_14770, partial [Candidatus Hodarchaeales archaeon]
MNSELTTPNKQINSEQERLHTSIFASEEYMGPDCSCNIEDTLKRKSSDIAEVNANTLAHTIQVTFDPQKKSIKEIEELLWQCGYKCSSVSSVSEEERPSIPSKQEHMDHHEHREHKGMDPAAHHQMMAKDMRNRFFITGILTIPVLLLSPTIQKWLDLTIPTFPGNELILLVFSSIIA